MCVCVCVCWHKEFGVGGRHDRTISTDAGEVELSGKKKPVLQRNGFILFLSGEKHQQTNQSLTDAELRASDCVGGRRLGTLGQGCGPRPPLESGLGEGRGAGRSGVCSYAYL